MEYINWNDTSIPLGKRKVAYVKWAMSRGTPERTAKIQANKKFGFSESVTMDKDINERCGGILSKDINDRILEIFAEGKKLGFTQWEICRGAKVYDGVPSAAKDPNKTIKKYVLDRLEDWLERGRHNTYQELMATEKELELNSLIIRIYREAKSLLGIPNRNLNRLLRVDNELLSKAVKGYKLSPKTTKKVIDWWEKQRESFNENEQLLVTKEAPTSRLTIKYITEDGVEFAHKEKAEEYVILLDRIAKLRGESNP